MKITVSSMGQMDLPAEWRERDHIHAGQQFSIERLAAGEYLLKKLPSPESTGLVAWLLACPEKGWFRPLPSQLTDTIAGQIRE
jgi:AbrB family looped-hinge helix DNA binding protein